MVAGSKVSLKQIDEQTVRFTLQPGIRKATVFVSSDASFDRQNEPYWSALKALGGATDLGFDKMAESNRAWWKSFWEKSLVHLHSADGVADKLEAGYTYFLYIMGSTSRGAYPTKFNGMLWTTGGDRRAWGGQFWGANQSCFYNNSLSAANHIELMQPMFDMYTAMLPSCQRAAREQWGSEGAYIPETVCFDGLGAAAGRHCRRDARFVSAAQTVGQHVETLSRLRRHAEPAFQPLELDGSRKNGRRPVDTRRARQRTVRPGDAHFFPRRKDRLSILAGVRIHAGSRLAG